MAVTLAPMMLRDVPLFNTVRNLSREWLHDPRAFTLPESVEWFRRGGGRQFYVILLDDAPIGYCRITDGGEATERLVGMDIHPDYRGRGLAKKTYAILFDTLRAGGVNKFRLRVLKKNARARHIYEALGFVTVSEDSSELEMVLV